MKNKILRFLSAILSLIICITLIFQPAFAQTDSQIIYSHIETLEDGFYIVDEIRISNPSHITLATANKSKSATRTYTGYNALNQKCWSFSLTGTFQYNGSTSKATAASSSYTIYKNGWKCSSKTATYSGNTVKGTATFTHSLTSTPVAIGMKCSASGTISHVNY